MKSHYPLLVQSADASVPAILKRQCMEAAHPDYGGFPEARKGFAEPAHGVGTAASLAVLYWNDRSVYHGDPMLLERAILACDHTLRQMHADGTMDLIETNFHDATSVGFAIWNVSPAYRVLKRYSRGSDLEARLEERLEEFMRRGADGMKHGGFHTPNHRWVMASAMAMLSNDLERPDLLADVQEYLDEGIDCNSDGEYTERSAGIYNVVNNKGLITVAEELGKWELLDHVKRNLYMVFTYLEPDDTILTINSRRQDLGKELYPFAYYENYLLAAHHLDNPHFAHMADELLQMTNPYEKDKSPLNRKHFPKPVALYMLNDRIRETEPRREAYDREHYERFYRDSSIVRIRDADVSLTVLAGKDVFFKLQSGALSVHCRFAASFFGDYGRFVPTSLEKTDEGYRLHYHSDRGYVRPLGRPDGAIADGRINTAHREHTHMQAWDVTVDVIPTDDGADLHIVCAGVEHLPCKLELLFPSGGHFDSDQAQLRAEAGQHLMVKNGSFSYAKGDDLIRVDGAFGGNTSYHYDLRGSLAQDPDAFTVYFTDFSPTTKTVRIRGR